MKTRLFAFAAAVVLVSCADVETQTGDGSQTAAAPVKMSADWTLKPQGDLNSFFDCLENNGAALVSAHRGGAYPGFPENSVAAMGHVLAQAPAVMEIDVATSADGVLYLMHDDTLDRTTTGSGPADGQDWNEIKDLRLKDSSGNTTKFMPPRFADALAFAKDRTILQIDFKQSTRYEDVVNEVKGQGADDRVIYIAYSMASARKLHRLHPEAMISLSVNSQSELNRAVAAGIPADRLLGFTGIEDPRPRLFNLLNDRDVEVIFGTLGGYDAIDKAIARSGDEERYAEIARQGVDVLATDRPIEAHKALAEAGAAPTAGACGVSRG